VAISEFQRIHTERRFQEVPEGQRFRNTRLVSLVGPAIEKRDKRAMLRDRKSRNLQEETRWRLLIEQAHRHFVQPASRDAQPQFEAAEYLGLATDQASIGISCRLLL
jgi:hypothetical protein